MGTVHIGQRRAVLRRVLSAAVCGALLVFAMPGGAANTGYAQGDGGARHDGHHRDDDAPIYMGNVAMAPVSQYTLGATFGSIVALAAAPGRAGQAVITASGQLCTTHVAGAADTASLQVTVDGVSAPGGSQTFTIPAGQAAGDVCSPFSLTGTFDAFSEQAHYIALQGQASSASAYVSGASLSAVLYPYRIGR